MTTFEVLGVWLIGAALVMGLAFALWPDEERG